MPHKRRQFAKNKNGQNNQSRKYLGNRNGNNNYDQSLFGEPEQPYRLLIHNLPLNTEPPHLEQYLNEKLSPNIPFSSFQLFDTFAWITVENRKLCNEAYTILHNSRYLQNQLILLKDKMSESDINSKYGWKVRVAEKRGSTLFTGRTRKVFVGNLPYQINAGEIRGFFQKRCGEIDDFRMSRGCCFIRFKEAKPSVHLALDYGGQEVFGRKIRVEEELDDSDRPNQRLREKTKVGKQQRTQKDEKHNEAAQGEEVPCDNVHQKYQESSRKERRQEKTSTSDNDDGSNDAAENNNNDEDTIEVTENVHRTTGPKFLSEEEIQEREFHFEPTESLFPKKKRRNKLQKKIEVEAAQTETRMEYVNHEGQKSFVHQKRKKKETVEDLDDMTVEELFVGQAPEKVVRKGRPTEDAFVNAEKDAPLEDDITIPSFATKHTTKKRKRDHDDVSANVDSHLFTKKERKKRRKERIQDPLPSSSTNAAQHPAQGAGAGLFDGEGPTEYEQKHHSSTNSRRDPKPSHPMDIIF
eukprot:CAMPEP_0117445724 /NCGR_PEP_ID=MMETSP0759-20121206/5951_1 /TAXON_ID=63605 /ORGANISM="Percolomonas cosmopolitus, Strain WS" /LENGTH=522 /DNA_ID=CAMNT_0005237925 /DNA_START=18 /DNA_END=1583 /DNA_ORIENTATION=+